MNFLWTPVQWRSHSRKLFISCKIPGSIPKSSPLYMELTHCTGHTAHRGSRGLTLLFPDHGTRRRWGFSVWPRPLFTQGKTRYPLYRRLGKTQGRSGEMRKISPPPGLDPRAVQPVASQYTDYASLPTFLFPNVTKIFVERIFCMLVSFNILTSLLVMCKRN